MPARATLRDHLLFATVLSVGVALSLPGVEARAEGDLAPSSRELTSLGGGPPPEAQGQSCAAPDPALVDKQYDAQRERMERLAAAMNAEGEGEFIALDGRGYGYFPEKSPALELARLQREAELQARAAERAAQQP